MGIIGGWLISVNIINDYCGRCLRRWGLGFDLHLVSPEEPGEGRDSKRSTQTRVQRARRPPTVAAYLSDVLLGVSEEDLEVREGAKVDHRLHRKMGQKEQPRKRESTKKAMRCKSPLRRRHTWIVGLSGCKSQETQPSPCPAAAMIFRNETCPTPKISSLSSLFSRKTATTP